MSQSLKRKQCQTPGKKRNLGATGPTCDRRGSVRHLFARSLHVYTTMGKCPRCWQRERGPGICALSMPSSPSFKSQLGVHLHCEALPDPSPLSEQLRVFGGPSQTPEASKHFPCTLHLASFVFPFYSVVSSSRARTVCDFPVFLLRLFPEGLAQSGLKSDGTD